ncbi:MAG: hypothetical protein FJ271_18470 [Planctomycetes bacterium]|nr:hypothetical protein [Planctomycetota bacterium]
MSIEKPDSSLWQKDSLPWIEKVVAEALARARQREESSPELGSAPDDLVRQIEAVTRRLHDFAAFVDAPKPAISEIDEQFHEGEEEMRQFLGNIEYLRDKLAHDGSQ